jgi:hypothetical protein
LVNMKEMIDSYCANKDLSYGSDQVFLNHIYDRFSDSATIHDEFFSGSPFPVKRNGYRFIGERIDIDEQPMGDDWRAIRTFYAEKTRSVIFIKKIRMMIRGLLNYK